jgi:hypothetical protein
MEKKPSIDQLISEISEIIEMIKHRERFSTEALPPSAIVSLDLLKISVLVLHEHLLKIFQEANIDIEKVKKEMMESHNTPSRDKQMIKRAMEVERDARILQLAFSKAMEQGKKRKKRKNSKEMKERRKLFKPLGGDKDWIPL